MKKMTRDELEAVYDKPDPWGYQTNPADIERKRVILEVLNQYGPFEKALDLCCGEGWITKDIPAKELYGYEASEQATARFPKNIIDAGSQKARIFREPSFDLVMVTGALYENYDWEKVIEIINAVGTKYLLTCHIADREYWKAMESIQFPQLIQIKHFDYHRSEEEQFTQRLRVYKR